MADLLRMSEATALGLHAMVSIAGEKEAVPVARLADELCASEAHLSKILVQLVRSRLLTSKRGPRGGYALADEAEKVSLLDVYEALEGPIRTDGCLFSEPVCHRVHCVLGDLVESVRSIVLGELRSTTLADAVRRGRR